MDAGSSQPTTIDLEPGSEWRFELENDEDIAVRVSGGLSSRFNGMYLCGLGEATRRGFPSPVQVQN